MNATSFHHPDLEQVLLDVARDPKAKLLRVPSSQDVVRVMRSEPIGVHAPGLRVAERHLLQVYREELAILLRSWCAKLLLDRGQDGERCRYDCMIDDRTAHDFSEYGKSSPRLRDHYRQGYGSDVHELLSLPDGTNGRAANVLECARVLARIDHGGHAWTYMAADHVDSGDTSAAFDAARVVLRLGQRSLLTFAWQSIARAQRLNGDFAAVFAAYERAREAAPASPTPLPNMLLAALHAEDERSARGTQQELDERLDASHPSVLATASSTWPRDVNRRIGRLAARLMEEGGSASARLLRDLAA